MVAIIFLQFGVVTRAIPSAKADPTKGIQFPIVWNRARLFSDQVRVALAVAIVSFSVPRLEAVRRFKLSYPTFTPFA